MIVSSRYITLGAKQIGVDLVSESRSEYGMDPGSQQDRWQRHIALEL
jgi:hypothetical protein